jgi:hypothetical protein
MARDPARDQQLMHLWYRPLSQIAATQPGRFTCPMKVCEYAQDHRLKNLMTILCLAFSEGSQSARYVSTFKDYFQAHLPHYNLVRFFLCTWRLQIQITCTSMTNFVRISISAVLISLQSTVPLVSVRPFPNMDNNTSHYRRCVLLHVGGAG